MRTQTLPPLVGHTAWIQLPNEHRPGGLWDHQEVVILSLIEPSKAVVQTQTGERHEVNVAELDCGYEFLLEGV
jgi:hypothetical protein